MEAITLRNGIQLQVKEMLDEEKVTKKKEKELEGESSQSMKEHQPIIPYPTKLKKSHMDEEFSRFVKLFKQLHINLPFIQALSQMPKYVNFLKELL